MDYTTLLFLHIISAVVLFGMGAGSAFYKFMADRSKNLEVIVFINKVVVLFDILFTTPSAIAQPITGFLLLNRLNLPLSTLWVAISIALFVISGLAWLIAVKLQIIMRDISIKALNSQEKLPKRYNKRYSKLVNIWILLGVVSFITMGSIFVLMVFKPSF